MMFDSDAYGVNTDNPESAYELIDHALTLQEEKTVRTAIKDFAEEWANEIFNTETWDEDMWQAWRDKLIELWR